MREMNMLNASPIAIPSTSEPRRELAPSRLVMRSASLRTSCGVSAT